MDYRLICTRVALVVRLLLAEVIKNKGLNHITVEELVADITPRGRATVPDAIKAELLQKIRKFLSQ